MPTYVRTFNYSTMQNNPSNTITSVTSSSRNHLNNDAYRIKEEQWLLECRSNYLFNLHQQEPKTSLGCPKGSNTLPPPQKKPAGRPKDSKNKPKSKPQIVATPTLDSAANTDQESIERCERSLYHYDPPLDQIDFWLENMPDGLRGILD